MPSKSFFKFAFAYAARSLKRNKRRTILTVLSVALSCTVSLVAQRYSEAIMRIWREGAADTGDAHAQIHHTGYWQKQEGLDRDLTLVGNNDIEKALSNHLDVEAFAKRLRFEGIVTNGAKSVYFVGTAVEPQAELKVSPRLFNPENDKGQFISDQDVNGVTIGKGLAETLGVTIGDELSLLATTASGGSNGIDVIVRGIVYVPLPSFSKRALYTHISRAQRLLGLEDRYTELAIRLRDVSMSKIFLKDMKDVVSSNEAEIRGWWDIQPLIPKVEIIWNSIIGIVCFLLFLSATLGVVNIVYILVAERTVEIGTLMALGAQEKGIRYLFMLEAAFIGMGGGAIGVLVANLIIGMMGWKGVLFDNPFGSGSVVVFPSNHALISLTVFCSATLICALAAVLPANKASRTEPVKAFRGQLG